MFCEKCGADVAEGSVYCSGCGARQGMPVPQADIKHHAPAVMVKTVSVWRVVIVTVVAIALLLAVWLASAVLSAVSLVNPNAGGTAATGVGMFVFLFVVFALSALILSLWANWTIAVKAGYDGVLSLLMLIPLVNVIVYFVFAFSDWPVLRELRELRRHQPPSGQR